TSVRNQFDNNLIQSLGESTSCKYYWTGGYCSGGNCSWTDGTPFQYTFWDKGQPDSNQCISSYVGTGEWHTIDCGTKECFVCETPQAMTDCADWYNVGYKDSGEYRIVLNNVSYNVLCDMNNGGGWTVFQSRVDGNESFWDRKWDEYKNGFNTEQMNKNSNFWLGLEALHQLSIKDVDVTLRIEMNGDRTPGSENPNDFWFVEYTEFKVGPEETNYTLQNMYVDWEHVQGNASTGWYVY
ncbi:fibrinogen beta and gamma chain, globular domain protein, partial [Necator americanus]